MDNKVAKPNEAPRFEDLPDFLTIQDLKRYLRIGTNKAYELANRKDFPKVHFGSKKVFPKQAVKEWMEREAARGMLPKKLRAI